MSVIRPLPVVRLGILLLGLTFASQAPAYGAAATSENKSGSTAKKTTATKAQAAKKKKSTYSARSSAQRRARLARARAAAQAREKTRLQALQALREAMTPRYKTDSTGALVPDVRAAAAIIFDPETGQVLWEENAQDQRSIASITKVMTALVFLEDNPDLSRHVTIQRSDVYAASTTFIRANERVTLDDLLHLTLISSDNAAARALARVSHGGTDAFIARMNEKAIELGLQNTSFADPSGLNPNNLSSAYDLSRLIAFAAADERLAGIMRMPEYRVATSRRSFNIRNTNRLLTEKTEREVDVMGGKTGFISKAGYCLATLLRLPQSNHQVAVVVLGATSNTARFWETRHLFNWLSEKASEIIAKEE